MSFSGATINKGIVMIVQFILGTLFFFALGFFGSLFLAFISLFYSNKGRGNISNKERKDIKDNSGCELGFLPIIAFVCVVFYWAMGILNKIKGSENVFSFFFAIFLFISFFMIAPSALFVGSFLAHGILNRVKKYHGFLGR